MIGTFRPSIYTIDPFLGLSLCTQITIDQKVVCGNKTTNFEGSVQKLRFSTGTGCTMHACFKADSSTLVNHFLE
jgi:hypothetical protein